jgi:hypothetical protein
MTETNYFKLVISVKPSEIDMIWEKLKKYQGDNQKA